MSTIFKIKIKKKTPANDGVRRQTPPPTKVFYASRGPGSYRRHPRSRRGQEE